MLLVYDLLLAPIHGLLWVFGKIDQAAREEIAAEADTITAELSQLYMMLETERLTEAEFELQERRLLDRLDAIRTNATGPGGGGEDVDDEHEEDEEGEEE